MDAEDFLANESEDLDLKIQDLIKWGKDLDYEKYSDEWFFKSTIFVNLDAQT